MSDASAQSLRSRRSVFGGAVGGLVHAGVAVVLWDYFGLDSLWELFRLKPLYGLYILLGMVALGAVPALFYVGRRAVSPAVVVALCLVVAGVGSWQTGPARAPVGGPTPFGIYVLGWVGVVGLAALLGTVERSWRRRAAG